MGYLKAFRLLNISYENKEININEARKKNLVMENSVDVKMKELMCTLTLSKDDSCK